MSTTWFTVITYTSSSKSSDIKATYQQASPGHHMWVRKTSTPQALGLDGCDVLSCAHHVGSKNACSGTFTSNHSPTARI
jgi:hypothetical protein